MANSFNQPLVLDTDFANYRTAASVSQGLRVLKMMLVVGSATAVAGSVTIVNPNNNQALYPPMAVGTQGPNTVLVNENLTGQAIAGWPNFSVTGLTATKTVLYIWFGL